MHGLILSMQGIYFHQPPLQVDRIDQLAPGAVISLALLATATTPGQRKEGTVKRDLELRHNPSELARFAEFWAEGP